MSSKASASEIALAGEPEPEAGHDEKIVFSEVAEIQMSRLSPREREKVVGGLVQIYGNILLKLFEMAHSTFTSLHDYKTLNLLANEKTTFALEGYSVRVEICSETLIWNVVSIGLPGSLEKYEIQRL